MFLVSERERSYRYIQGVLHQEERRIWGSEPHCLESGTGPASDELCALELGVPLDFSVSVSA